MANRNTLSVMKLEDFKAWLIDDGWQIQVPRGFYEVLRATKEGRKHPLIVYWRHDTNGNKKLVHYTVLDRDMGVVRAFSHSKIITHRNAMNCTIELRNFCVKCNKMISFEIPDNFIDEEIQKAKIKLWERWSYGT